MYKFQNTFSPACSSNKCVSSCLKSNVTSLSFSGSLYPFEESPNMSDVYQPSERVKTETHLASMDEYRRMHSESVTDPVGFWSRIADGFHWHRKPSKEKFFSHNFNVNDGPISIKWMEDGLTNLCYNCLDRHLEKNGSKVAFFWEGNEPKDEGKITIEQLHKEVCRFANVLKNKGVKKVRTNRICRISTGWAKSHIIFE